MDGLTEQWTNKYLALVRTCTSYMASIVCTQNSLLNLHAKSQELNFARDFCQMSSTELYFSHFQLQEREWGKGVTLILQLIHILCMYTYNFPHGHIPHLKDFWYQGCHFLVPWSSGGTFMYHGSNFG